MLDAWWTDTDFVFRFSNDRFLHIFVTEASPAVAWQLDTTPPLLPECALERIGSPPVLIRWPSAAVTALDRSALSTKRRGCRFRLLFVNQSGLLLYLQDCPTWGFHPVRRADLDQPVLYVCDEQ